MEQSRIHIPGTRSTPEVLLDPGTGTYRISGISIPENASEFYTPIIDWLRTHIPSLPEPRPVVFEMEYFNSSSMKTLFLILMELKNGLGSGRIKTINWLVEEDDESMIDAGETLAELAGIKMNVVIADK